jgi:hypothetical protein|tara:strand:- start:1612 stop:1992 length:381 start_codon:yes stop_codon:yes gene_type:complete
MDNVARMEVPNRMRSINVRMIIDNMPIVSTIDYIINLQGVIPVAIWVKTKKSESTLDRELRSSGKAVSLLLQFGCPIKEIAETFTRDSIIGSAVWYINKNLEDIITGNQPDKLPNLSTQPTGYTIK